MRYSSHQPRAFRNRIARNLGVLVAAALVAALGLPSAVQAQTPAAPMVSAEMSETSSATLTATWGQPLSNGDSDQDQWLLEYTEPDVAWNKATRKIIEDRTVMMLADIACG